MSKSVLVVDDSPVITMLWRLVLENAGYTITHANDGRKAINMLSNNRYDAFIVDYHMGDMNGVELTTKIRTMSGHAFKPIIMITADRNEDIRQGARQAGINAWMTKPVNPDNLLKVMKELCPLDG